MVVGPLPSRDDPDRYLAILGSSFYRTLTRLHDLVMSATVDFWRARDVRCLLLPVTTGAVSSPMGVGSDSTPMRVNMAGVETYLADSMQFMLEYGCRLSPAGCYYLMPSFRGEHSDETHLSQFFHSEAEIPGGLDDVMATVEEYVLHLCDRVLASDLRGDGLPNGEAHLKALVAAGTDAFTRICFEDAVSFLGEDGTLVSKRAPGVRSLTRAGEQALIDEFGDFVWLTEHDALSVPFYQRRSPGAVDKSANADLLFGIGEVVGAGERHPDGDSVLEALAVHQVPSEDYAWYVRMKSELPLRTSGFGLGIERFLMWVMRHKDIRDLQLLLRDNGRIFVP